MHTLVIDGSGGRSLFDLPEAEAAAMLMTWWRHHGERYRRWREVKERRDRMALVPTHDDRLTP